MAKVTWKILGPDHPIFKEGFTITSHRKKRDEIICPECSSQKVILRLSSA